MRFLRQVAVAVGPGDVLGHHAPDYVVDWAIQTEGSLYRILYLCEPYKDEVLRTHGSPSLPSTYGIQPLNDEPVANLTYIPPEDEEGDEIVTVSNDTDNEGMMAVEGMGINPSEPGRSTPMCIADSDSDVVLEAHASPRVPGQANPSHVEQEEGPGLHQPPRRPTACKQHIHSDSVQKTLLTS